MTHSLTKLDRRPPQLDGRGPKEWPAVACSCGVKFLWDPKKGVSPKCPTCKTVAADLLAPPAPEGEGDA